MFIVYIYTHIPATYLLTWSVLNCWLSVYIASWRYSDNCVRDARHSTHGGQDFVHIDLNVRLCDYKIYVDLFIYLFIYYYFIYLIYLFLFPELIILHNDHFLVRSDILTWCAWKAFYNWHDWCEGLESGLENLGIRNHTCRYFKAFIIKTL